jgi:hypothetical protein
MELILEINRRCSKKRDMMKNFYHLIYIIIIENYLSSIKQFKTKYQLLIVLLLTESQYS